MTAPTDLVVTAITEPAPSIRTFTLAAADGSALADFVPGSHLVVQAGDRLNAYSLTSDGFAPDAYSISVLRVPNGNGGSVWMHDRVRVGDTLHTQLPRSAFAPVGRARRQLMIAGGIGVTPIVSHLRAARRWQREVQVLYVFRPEYAAHIGDVAALAGSAAEFYAGRAEFRDRLAHTLVEQPMGTHLYVCGPAGMIEHVTTTAAALGWPSSRIHLERFGNEALDAGDPFTVTLNRTGRMIDVPSGTSVLEALEGHGIEVANLCRQGVCGQCRIELLRGRPVHRDLFLTEGEKQAGDAFMPCVSRAGNGTNLEVAL